MLTWTLILTLLGYGFLASLWALYERRRAQELSEVVVATLESHNRCKSLLESVDDKVDENVRLGMEVLREGRKLSIASQNLAKDGVRALNHSRRVCGGDL
jgi:hypothetical protein